MSSDVVVLIGVGGTGQAIARRSGSGRRPLLADVAEETLETAAARLREEGGESGNFIRRLVAMAPAKPHGTPDDIAAAAAFLLGPDAAFVTGTDLLVDGGVVAALRAAR